MKKLILILSVISIFFLAGCNVNENDKNNELSGDINNQQQEIIENGAFSNEQLIEMVKKYREARSEYIPEFIVVEDDDNNVVTIHLYDVVDEHTATSDWYYIDRNSGIGENLLGETIDLNKITEQDESWFVTDSYHAQTPGAWGGETPELYYFSSDNTYTWTISSLVQNERVVATKGTWEIKNGKLILHEKEQTYRDGGEFIESYNNPLISDGELVLVDYTTITRLVDNEIVKNMEYVGVADYWLQIYEDAEQPKIKEYEYKLDGETWFSNVPWDEIDVSENNDIVDE